MIRTLFLLKYLNEPDLRRTIHAATNKSEQFNDFAQWLMFGGHGVIAENVRHEQRKVIKYNHLVANMPPKDARGILDRLNEIGFNASVVLEINAIEAVNRVLDSVGEEAARKSRFKPVRFHLIRDDDFLAKFGFVSKSSTSWSLLKTLFERGREVADVWLENDYAKLGQASSLDVKGSLLDPTLKHSGNASARRN